MHIRKCVPLYWDIGALYQLVCLRAMISPVNKARVISWIINGIFSVEYMYLVNGIAALFPDLILGD